MQLTRVFSLKTLKESGFDCYVNWIEKKIKDPPRTPVEFLLAVYIPVEFTLLATTAQEIDIHRGCMCVCVCVCREPSILSTNARSLNWRHGYLTSDFCRSFQHLYSCEIFLHAFEKEDKGEPERRFFRERRKKDRRNWSRQSGLKLCWGRNLDSRAHRTIKRILFRIVLSTRFSATFDETVRAPKESLKRFPD